MIAATRPRSSDYGAAHTKARKAWAAAHDPSHLCTRCRHPLGPMGPHLHLDHSADRTYYAGFAHARCNVGAAALVANARSKAKRGGWSTEVTSRPL